MLDELGGVPAFYSLSGKVRVSAFPQLEPPRFVAEVLIAPGDWALILAPQSPAFEIETAVDLALSHDPYRHLRVIAGGRSNAKGKPQ